MTELSAKWGGWYQNVLDMGSSDSTEERSEFLTKDPLVARLREIEECKTMHDVLSTISRLTLHDADRFVDRANSPLLDDLCMVVHGTTGVKQARLNRIVNRNQVYLLATRLAAVRVDNAEFFVDRKFFPKENLNLIFQQTARLGHTEMCRFMLQRWTDQTRASLRNALQLAVDNGHVSVASLLFESLPDAEPCLRKVARFGHLAMCQYLHETKRIESMDDVVDVFCDAVANEQFAICEYLCKHFPNIRVQPNQLHIGPNAIIVNTSLPHPLINVRARLSVRKDFLARLQRL